MADLDRYDAAVAVVFVIVLLAVTLRSLWHALRR
jgi:hypothetical protein